MSNSTYLGQKGYSIYKDSINFKDISWIKNELLVRPYIPKSPVQPEAFPIYLESPKKIYIPRFFGIKHFGFRVRLILKIAKSQSNCIKFC